MHKGVKIFISFVFLLTLFRFTTGTVEAAGFDDVTDQHWAKEEIEYLLSQGITDGYNISGRLLFKPNDKITRAQAAKMLVIAKGKEKLNNESSYQDVPTGHWASGYIERATSEGYFSGDSNGKFHPEDLLTRAEMSKVIALAFDLNHEDISTKADAFNDIQTSWAKGYIKALYYGGIAAGSNQQFQPNKDITRAEFAAFLSRALNDDFKLDPATPAIPTPTPTTPTAPVVTEPVSDFIAKGTATVSSLNVRSAANASSSIMGTLSKGDTVNIYELNGYWAKVNFEGKVGYVHKTFLKLDNITSNDLKDRIIVVDAGHGGKDPGTSQGSSLEKNITLSVTKLVEQKLKNDGAKVIMTRSSDTYPTLEDRVAIAQQNYAELFVSIHVNSAGSSSASGTETYYNTSKNQNASESAELAKEIQKQLVSLAGTKDRGTKTAEFYVVKQQNTPSVLVELGYITNQSDLQKLNSTQYQELFAEAIYRGIKSYYSK